MIPSVAADVPALAQRTLELCQIASPITQEKALADHVEVWAKNHFPASQVRRISHSLIVGTFEDPRSTVALIGHIDTVPPHPQGKPPRIEGDRIHGLGSSDMKGGVAVMMALAEKLPLDRLPVNLVLIFYEREEGTYVESGLIPLFDKYSELKRVKFGIALEPTDNVVQVGCVGTMQVTLRFRGKSAHSARPWQGKNAIHLAGPFLTELSQREPVKVVCEGFQFMEVANVTTAQGGRARNVIPDEFVLNLNYRFAPGKTNEEAKQDVVQLVAGRAEVELLDISPSGRVCADNPQFKKLLQVTGLPAEPKQAWTDVARFAIHGIDAVNFGPGEVAQAHQQSESAPIPALGVAFEKMAAFLST